MPPTQGYVAEDPGKTLGIVSLITSILGIGLVGLITGIIGRNKSKAAGYSNGMALAGIIISSISMVVGLIFGVLFIIGMVVGLSAIDQKCKELGPGVHYEGSAKYTCGADGKNSYDSSSSYSSN